MKALNAKTLNSFPTRLANILCVLLLIVLSGCAGDEAGEWTDDAGNWQRAFGDPAPDGVTVLNSWYMRTTHFTAEYAWFFKVQLDAKNTALIESSTDYDKLGLEAASRAVQDTFSDRPSWFPTDKPEGYDVYQSKSQSNFIILLERGGTLSYWTSWQL
jgi:hypothetical protein